MTSAAASRYMFFEIVGDIHRTLVSTVDRFGVAGVDLNWIAGLVETFEST